MIGRNINHIALQKTVQKLLKNKQTTETELSPNPAIPLDVHPKEIKSECQKSTCMPIFNTALYNNQDMEFTWVSADK